MKPERFKRAMSWLEIVFQQCISGEWEQQNDDEIKQQNNSIQSDENIEAGSSEIENDDLELVQKSYAKETENDDVVVMQKDSLKKMTPQTLILREPQRHPPGRPAANKQRIFQKTKKTFEKLPAHEKDHMRLAWFVNTQTLQSVFRGDAKINKKDLLCPLPARVYDERSQIDDIKTYFSDKAWSKIQRLKKSTLDKWKCDVCDSDQSDKIQKWLQCDKCLAWFHYTCLGITRKPSGYWFCVTCNG